jgi:hypothetical protein
MEVIRNTYNNLAGKSEGKLLEKTWRKNGDNTKINLKDVRKKSGFISL